LLAFDNHERLVEDCSVYKEPVFRPLYLNIPLFLDSKGEIYKGEC
jgi:hypothetical protein